MNLHCALCLHQQVNLEATDRILARRAVTIANGQALCEQHFISIHNLVDTAGGGPALNFLREAGRRDLRPNAP